MPVRIHPTCKECGHDAFDPEGTRKRRVYICTECGHPHNRDELVDVESDTAAAGGQLAPKEIRDEYRDRELTPREKRIAAAIIMNAFRGELKGELRDKCREALNFDGGMHVDDIHGSAKRIMSACEWFRGNSRDGQMLERVKVVEAAAAKIFDGCRPAGAECGICTGDGRSDATRTCARCGMHVCGEHAHENPGRPYICIECHNEGLDFS